MLEPRAAVALHKLIVVRVRGHVRARDPARDPARVRDPARDPAHAHGLEKEGESEIASAAQKTKARAVAAAVGAEIPT